MTDEEARAAIRKIRKQKQQRAFSNALAVIGIAALLIAVYIVNTDRVETKETAGKYSEGLDQVNSSLGVVCEKTGNKEVLPVQVKEDCARAENGQKPPVVESAPPVAAPQINIDALYSAVRSVVNAELAANPPKDGKPGEAPPPEAIIQRVREVYQANKPADGKTPSDGELLSLIRKVYKESPPKDGKDATQDQADLAIQKYCSRPELPCKGDPGTSGAPGKDAPVADGSRFARGTDGECYLFTHYSNGTEISAKVNGDAQAQATLCGPESEPPPTTPTG